MPTGPQGQKRPADLIGCAVKVARLSVGDETETARNMSGRTRSGKAGAAARSSILSPEERHNIAKKAASVRWV